MRNQKDINLRLDLRRFAIDLDELGYEISDETRGIKVGEERHGDTATDSAWTRMEYQRGHLAGQYAAIDQLKKILNRILEGNRYSENHIVAQDPVQS